MVSCKPRKLIGADKLDFCFYFETQNSIKSPFVRNMFQSARNTAPQFFKKCSITGIVSMIDFANKNLIGILPMGKYVIKARMYHDQTGVKQTRIDLVMSFTVVAD